tara:strand:+ start:62 stop:223 length:162 start_codon:yes stop_codon:yes gene_type:complete
MLVKLKKQWIEENIELRKIIDHLMQDKENIIKELKSIHQQLKNIKGVNKNASN